MQDNDYDGYYPQDPEDWEIKENDKSENDKVTDTKEVSIYDSLCDINYAFLKQPNKKLKHNYTNEIELKSLLIRIKNERGEIGSYKYNTRINKYIKWFISINSKKYDPPSKRNRLKALLKKKIVQYSETTRIDNESYERFGQIILLMIKNILKKPQFSGYTYRDDFYSDAVYKILKYLGNFDHNLISERTGTPVNAFAYISQIIHNSILFIINTKKKENDRLKHQVQMANLEHSLQLKCYELVQNPDQENTIDESNLNIKTIDIDYIHNTLIEELEDLLNDSTNFDRVDILYPKEYRITFEEYNELKEILKGNINIMRKK